MGRQQQSVFRQFRVRRFRLANLFEEADDLDAQLVHKQIVVDLKSRVQRRHRLGEIFTNVERAWSLREPASSGKVTIWPSGPPLDLDPAAALEVPQRIFGATPRHRYRSWAE
jgi:hypothetical protein